MNALKMPTRAELVQAAQYALAKKEGGAQELQKLSRDTYRLKLSIAMLRPEGAYNRTAHREFIRRYTDTPRSMTPKKAQELFEWNPVTQALTFKIDTPAGKAGAIASSQDYEGKRMVCLPKRVFPLDYIVNMLA